MKVILFLVLLVSCTLGQLSSDDINTLIALHTQARNNANPAPQTALPALTWDNTIAAYAQSWVDKCEEAYSPKYYASLYGENAVIMYPNLDVTAAFNFWMEQAQYFDFASKACYDSTCRNYIQIVAARSTTFGCAAQSCSFGMFLVCDYRRYYQYSGVRPYVPAGTPVSTTTGSGKTTTSGAAIATISTSTSTTGRSATSTTGKSSTSTTGRSATSTTGSTPSSTSGTGYAKIDYRGTPAVGAVKDQGQCGSCWAFSATAITEGAIGFKGTQPPPLSDQDTLDCSGGGSCNGGWPLTALQGIIKAGGLDTQSSYPYKASDQTCGYVSSHFGGTITKAGNAAGNFASMYNALKTYGPVGITVDADNAWQSYRSGVLSSTSTSIDHAVTVVGYEPSLNAWIVRNSWGTSWGLSGYCYLDANAPCGAQQNGAYWAIA